MEYTAPTLSLDGDVIITALGKFRVGETVYVTVNDDIYGNSYDGCFEGVIDAISNETIRFLQGGTTERYYRVDEIIGISKHGIELVPSEACSKQMWKELAMGHYVLLPTKSNIRLLSRKCSDVKNRYPESAMFNIYFTDRNGNEEDSTQFTTEGGKKQQVFNELLTFWDGFSYENGFTDRYITEIEYVGIDPESEEE